MDSYPGLGASSKHPNHEVNLENSLISNEGCNMNNKSNVSAEESNDSIGSNFKVRPKPPRTSAREILRTGRGHNKRKKII